MAGPDDSMSVCESCGKMVPSANMQLHHTRACPNRKLPARRTTEDAAMTDSNNDGDNNDETSSMALAPMFAAAATASAPLEIYDTDTDDSVLYCSPPTSPSVAQPRVNAQPLTVFQPSTASASPRAPPIVDGYEVVEHPAQPQPRHYSATESATSPGSPWRRITSGISNALCNNGSPSFAAADGRSSSPVTLPYPGARRRRGNHRAIDLTKDDTNEQQQTAEDQWACPRCTLLNPIPRTTCEACHYNKNGDNNTQSGRAGSDVRSQRTFEAAETSAAYGHSRNVAIGGALFGGVMGAASAFARGRPVAGAALDGALNGAVGSVVLNEIVQQVERSGSSQGVSRRQAVDNNNRRGRDVQRTSIDDLVAMSLMQQEMNQALRSSGRRPGYATHDPMNQYMMAMGRIHPHGRHVDVSRMSYEELLARFGDGSENRGASAAQLRQLPVQTIADASQLGDECKECSICLDEFKSGDKRKTLPCLHGFHENCANKWLSTNASCPICKHRVGD